MVKLPLFWRGLLIALIHASAFGFLVYMLDNYLKNQFGAFNDTIDLILHASNMQVFKVVLVFSTLSLFNYPFMMVEIFIFVIFINCFW